MRKWFRGLDLGMMKVILALAWPTMLEQLLQTAVQYIDTAMVGALGTEATAAVGATTTVGWLVGGMVSAFGVGFLALSPVPAARRTGRRPQGPQPRRCWSRWRWACSSPA